MKLVTKVLAVGSIVGLVRYMRRHRTQPAATGDLADVATQSGISDVDPQAISQVSAEGIDVDATEAAHTEIQEQRDRLPRPGDNLP